MKKMSKIIMLVALILLVTLTACERAAERPSVVTPSAGAGEVPFPVDTQDLSAIGTQTAIASTPLPVLPSSTPQVLVPTDTPAAGDQTGNTDQATATSDANAGGGVSQAAFPTPEVSRPTTYTLKRGEWPICIARRYDLDLSSFFAANGLNMNSQPAAGISLKVPSSGNWSSSQYGARSLKAHPVDYTVVSGDSIYSIACKYGDVTPEAILAVNNISEGDLKAGMTIHIP